MWFTETPWPPIFICIAGMVLLGAAWRQNARKLYLFGFTGLGVACLAIFGFERWYVTEPERVEGRVHELADAVEADDVERVLAFFSKDELALRNKIRLGMSRFRIEGGLRITDMDARYNDDKTSVVCRFRANGVAAVKSDATASRHVSTMWEFTWKREGDDWWIAKLQRLDPRTEKPIPLTSRQD